MSTKGNGCGPIVLAVVLNLSLTLLLIIFVAHQQIEIANLRQMVADINQNKEVKIESTSTINDRDRSKPEDILPQENNTESSNQENEQFHETQYTSTRVARGANPRCCGKRRRGKKGETAPNGAICHVLCAHIKEHF